MLKIKIKTNLWLLRTKILSQFFSGVRGVGNHVRESRNLESSFLVKKGESEFRGRSAVKKEREREREK